MAARKKITKTKKSAPAKKAPSSNKKRRKAGATSSAPKKVSSKRSGVAKAKLLKTKKKTATSKAVGTKKRKSTAVAKTKSKSTASKKAPSKVKSTAPKRNSTPLKKTPAKSPTAKKGSTKRSASTTSKKQSVPEPPAQRLAFHWGSTRIELASDTDTIPKTKLTKKELREFEKMLLDKRRELVGDVENLTNEALKGGGEAYAGRSHMPFHMADVGTDNWEQEFTLGLIANERALVREIDDALERIDNRTFGICLATHRPIDKPRLCAKPWAKYCIEYARLRELGRVP